MDTYYRLVVRFAPLTIVLTSLLVTGASVVCYLTAPPPDIDDPSKGSDPRGTPIKGRANSLAKFFETDPSSSPDISLNLSLYEDTWVIQSLASAYGSFSFGDTSGEGVTKETCNDLTDEDGFNVIFRGNGETNDMKSLPVLKAMCTFEELAREQIAEVLSDCPVHSVGYHMALLTNTTCQQLEEEHLEQAVEIIAYCSDFYHSGKLSDQCLDGCKDVPSICRGNNSIYILLHYLTDVGFMNDDRYKDEITYSQVVFPLRNVSQAATFYYWIENLVYDGTHISLIAADPKFKLSVYEDSLRNDLLLFILAMGLIVLLVYIYVRSLFITIALVLDVAFSYGLAYFMYFIVFRITFFPFINLMAGLLVIALAADSLFLFVAAWAQAKAEAPSDERWQWMKSTMKHVAASVTITMLTTAGALYVNALSPITNLRCFAIFTGTCIMCNLILVLVLLPAIIVCDDVINAALCSKCSISCTCLQRANGTISRMWNSLFKMVIPAVIRKGADICLILLIGLGIWGFVSVYYKPKFEVPTTSYYQLFNKENLMEVYEVEYKEEFRFELTYDTTNSDKGLPIFFVWGLDDKDNGNYYDPEDNGTLVFDTSFDVSLPSSQNYLATFCHKLREQSFAAPYVRIQPCMMDLFSEFMSAPCALQEQKPCCGQKAPVNSALFDECFPQFVVLANDVLTDPGIILGTPFFDENNHVEAFMMIIQSTQEFVQLFKEMDDFYKKVTGFIDNEIVDAPPSVNNVWMTSYFQFYNMQLALVFGAYVAFGSSIGIAFVIVMLTTRNIILTFYTLTSITLAIFVTVGSLVWIGWELNVLESFILSLAVGLSVDFTIHYGVAYTLSTEKSRAARVTEAFELVGSPVAMAALTTFLAGVAMIPASVRGYQQVGEFLMLAMIVSWFYATFFFQSLCRNLGPLEGQGTFSFNCFSGKKKKPPVSDAEHCQEQSQTPDTSTKRRNRRERKRQKRRQQQQLQGMDNNSSSVEGSSERTPSPSLDPASKNVVDTFFMDQESSSTPPKKASNLDISTPVLDPHSKRIVASFFMDESPPIPPKQMMDMDAQSSTFDPDSKKVIDSFFMDEEPMAPPKRMMDRDDAVAGPSGFISTTVDKSTERTSTGDNRVSKETPRVHREKHRRREKHSSSHDHHETGANKDHKRSREDRRVKNNPVRQKQNSHQFTHSTPIKPQDSTIPNRTEGISCISSPYNMSGVSAPPLLIPRERTFDASHPSSRQFALPRLPPFVAYDLYVKGSSGMRDRPSRRNKSHPDGGSNSSTTNLISVSADSSDSSLLT